MLVVERTDYPLLTRLKNAAKIFYNQSFTENVLDLDPLGEIAPSTPLYNQKLTINLHPQEGSLVEEKSLDIIGESDQINQNVWIVLTINNT